MFKIKTFSNNGKNSYFFKAYGHPEVTPDRLALVEKIHHTKKVALYDPEGVIEDFLSLSPLKPSDIDHWYVQAVEQLDHTLDTLKPQLIYDIHEDQPDLLIVLDFEETHMYPIRHVVPEDCVVENLSSVMLPVDMRSATPYLSGLNFATNFVWMKEKDGVHTRLFTTNYWARYGAKNPTLHAYLFDEDGNEIVRWQDQFNDTEHAFVLDSKQIKERFNLNDFVGQLFIHMVGAKGHDILKYALDIYDDVGKMVTATHDANSWPSDYMAGLPAPKSDQRVIFWAQNSHPVPIEPGTISFNVMGEEKSYPYMETIPPFGTKQILMNDLMPDVAWPQQIEIVSHKTMVRSRYEVQDATTSWLGHVNVQRTDLKPDPHLPKFSQHVGKGFILTAPLFPDHACTMLPTPMAREQKFLPTKIMVYTEDGNLVKEHSLGNLPRNHTQSLALSELLGSDLPPYGHLELVYDFEVGQDADGWLHSLFRYNNQRGFSAETSFGSHMFNMPITYRNEPQSYKGKAPGLSTRLFLHIDQMPNFETFCHLIYPTSTTWHEASHTILELYNGDGKKRAEHIIHIPRSGSIHWTPEDYFDKNLLSSLENPYIFIRDTSCRLFGYHGTRHKTTEAFSLDHMFGF